jgi:hypothetical protein
MVLFSMVDDYIIDPVDIQFDKIRDQFELLGGVDGVNQSGLLAATDKVRVITRTVRERNQLVKDPPVKINRSDPVNPMNNFS